MGDREGPFKIVNNSDPPHDPQLTIRDSQSILELWLNADLFQPDVDLRTAAVHQNTPDTDGGKENNVGNHASLSFSKGGPKWITIYRSPLARDNPIHGTSMPDPDLTLAS